MSAVQSEWSFGPISGPVCGGLGAAGLVLAHPLVGFPMWLPMLFAVVGALAAVLVGAARDTTPGNIWFRAVCWLGAGGWTVWTLLAGWSWTTTGVLGVAALALGMLAPVFAPHVERDPNAPPLLSGIMPGGLAAEWAERITRICKIEGGVVVSHVKRWPSDTGYTLTVKFPAESGYRWTDLRDHQDNMAAAKDLPNGCPITAEIGDHQGGAVLHVSTVNGLAEVLPFPCDYRERSVRDDFQIGHFLDKSATCIELYQSAGIIAGERDGGKTVLLQNVTGNLVQCGDAVVWHIDLNGGGISAPWTIPFALGQVDRPAVDWVANGPEEAEAMAEVGLRIAKDRKSRYQHLLIQNDTDVLPVSPKIPAIIIVVDEGGEMLGSDAPPAARRAAAKLRELQRIGRAMCVNVAFSVQRATGEYVPSQMKKNAKLSICLPVKDNAEIAHLLDWNKDLRSADLLHAGCGYIRRGKEVPRQFKGYLLRPAQIAEIARVTAAWRPELDDPAQRVAGEVYARRWERQSRWLRALRGEEVDGFEPDLPPTSNLPASSSGTSSDSPDARTRSLEQMKTETIALMRKMSRRTPAVREALTMPTDRLLAELDAIAALPPVDPPQPEAIPAAAAEPVDVEFSTLDERKALAVRVITAAGPDGLAFGEVVEAVNAVLKVKVTRQTVSVWLADEAKAGRLRTPQKGVWVATGQATTP